MDEDEWEEKASYLEELIPGTEFESQEVEYKLTLDRSNPDSWLRK